MKRRCLGGLLALVGALCTLPAQASGYPERPVKLIVPFAAGGSTDLLARVVARAFEKEIGQPFVVENVGGAGATLGTARVAHAPADGYTLLLGSSSALVIAPHLYKVGYDGRTSFEPIGKVATASFVLMTRAGSGMDHFEQLVARAHAEPGRLTFGSPGTGSALHLAIEMMLDRAKLQAVHVPFTGSAPVYTALLGSHIDFMVDSPSGAVPMVKSGRIVALAVTSRTREHELPKVPTLEELGLKDFEAMAWFAMMAPKGTPQAVVQRLGQTLVQVLKQPEVRSAMAGAGFRPVEDSGTLSADITREYARWGDTMARSGVKLDK
ncbi:tripartite tricarboxylate transporter substrate binding protein [Variovorax paradoxus]|uniref:Tripartite tricarboxylate transporter substrate binding protein n=1 Tax=Variovorax paradoxus TaxID=34073 RepID=A0A5Q0M5Q7_VARPD|nr:tripartite tricarboxylate transporter substrate binding protein [Variovorax paradoxus]